MSSLDQDMQTALAKTILNNPEMRETLTRALGEAVQEALGKHGRSAGEDPLSTHAGLGQLMQEALTEMVNEGSRRWPTTRRRAMTMHSVSRSRAGDPL